jgi:hypothetical protein
MPSLRRYPQRGHRTRGHGGHLEQTSDLAPRGLRSVSYGGLAATAPMGVSSRSAQGKIKSFVAGASATSWPRPGTGGMMDVLQTLLIGLVAGAIATVVLTVVEYADMAATKRPASLVPGKVLVSLTGGDPQTDVERAKKLNWPVHVMHGTAVGVVFAALSLLDLSAVLTTVLFYVLLLGLDWVMYVVLRVTPPPWRWSGSSMVRELVLKGVFAAAVGIAFYALEGLF